MEKSRLFLSLLIIVAVSILFFLPASKAYALKYGPSSYSSYPAYYNTHPLPTPKFFKGKVLKMLVEIDYPNQKRWNYAISVISNVMKAFGYNSLKYKIELVAFGAGLKMMMPKFDKKNEAVLQSLVSYGLKIRACHNTMLKLHLTKKALFPFIRVVPAGVLEVARRGMQGYVLLKP